MARERLGEAQRRKLPHRLQWRKRRKFIYGCGENMARALGLAGKGAIRADQTDSPSQVRGRSGTGGAGSWP